MSINWTKKEFAARLIRTNINAASVVVGDIIFDDDNPWEVAKVERKRGRFYFYDEDDNGGGGYKPDDLIKVLPSSSRRKP